jgi:hypothetical protein
MPNDKALLKRFMDEASIRNTIARFADSATRFDTDMFRTVWADDAEFIIGLAPHGQSATGVDDIVAMLRRVRAGRDFFVQFALPGVIDIDGDEATTRTLCHEAARGPGKTYYRNHSIASIGCGARVTGGCSQVVPSNICGSTPPRSRATRSRFFPR